MSRRLSRLNEQLKREISAVLHTSVRDPRVGHPTVTDVRVDSDLSLARVYVRPNPAFTGPGSPADAPAAGRVEPPVGRSEEILEALRIAGPFIRRELGKRLDVRRVPELRFEIDRTFENVLRIERILTEVRAQRSETEGDADDGADGAADGKEP